MKKLTKAQEKVLDKMIAGTWVSAYDIQASMATLDAMHKKGYLSRRNESAAGAIFSPRTTIEYCKKYGLDKPSRHVLVYGNGES